MSCHIANIKTNGIRTNPFLLLGKSAWQVDAASGRLLGEWMPAMSIYIPQVVMNITETDIRDIMHSLNLGCVEHVEMVTKTATDGREYSRVFVHFSIWNISDDAKINVTEVIRTAITSLGMNKQSPKDALLSETDFEWENKTNDIQSQMSTKNTPNRTPLGSDKYDCFQDHDSDIECDQCCTVCTCNPDGETDECWHCVLLHADELRMEW
jgi:hypothetical protein